MAVGALDTSTDCPSNMAPPFEGPPEDGAPWDDCLFFFAGKRYTCGLSFGGLGCGLWVSE